MASIQNPVGQSRTSIADALLPLGELLNQMHDPVSLIDPVDGQYLFINRAAEGLLGYALAEVAGARVGSMSDSEAGFSPERVRALLADLPAGGLRKIDWCARQRDGSLRWLELNISILDLAGRAILMVVGRDISDRKQAEAARDSHLSRLKTVFDTSNAGIFISGPDGRISMVNQRLADMFGRRPEDMVGSLYWELVSEEQQAEGQRLYRMLIRGEISACDVERHYRRSDGSEFWGMASGRRLTGPRGEAEGLLAVIIDISRRKAVEAALDEARQVAEAATRAKSEFLANMSHEIRTPINAIVGLAYILERSGLNPRQQDLLGQMQGATRVLQTTVSDILDFSKVEAGRLDIEQAPFNLDQVFDELACVVGVAAEGKDVEINFDLAPEVPRRLIGDPLRLEQVLNNLVGNAIKFTPEGDVTVAVALSPASAPGHVQLDFSVSDTGIGIAADIQQRLFAAFTQADASTSRRFGGTGLGLAITQRLVQLMGGSVRLDSAPGRGSCFSFSLGFPLPEGEASGQSGLAVPDWLLGRRICVAERNPSSRAALVNLLRAQGVQVCSAASPDELAPGGCADATPGGVELIMIDADFLVTLIRAGKHRRDSRYVVAMRPGISEGVSKIIDESSARVVGQLLKPVTRAPLLEVLASAFGADWSAGFEDEAGELPIDEAVLEGCHVLLVEDSPINRDVLGEILHSFGMSVEAAADGRHAIALAREAALRSGLAAVYDLILLDLQMPGIDGFETARAIRELPGSDSIPMVAVSAYALARTSEDCWLAGIDDFAAKPVNVPELRQLLARRLGLGRATLPMPALASALAPATAPLPAVGPATVGSARFGINVSEAMQRVAEQPEALQRLLDHFLDYYTGFPAEIEQAVLSGDRSTARQKSHDLVGALATIGAVVPAQRARAIELACSEGREVNPDLLHHLRDDFHQLEQAARVLYTAGEL